jgi:hypothetical protein
MQRYTRVGLTVLAVAALALPAVGVFGAEATPPAGEAGTTPDTISFGGDLRLRQEAFDDIPIVADPPGVTRGGENDYFRIRPRFWSQWDPTESFTVNGRIVNEFRHWNEMGADGAPDTSTYEFPDELVVDSLYMEARNLADGKLDVKVGRQDLIYGTGKVILEGTPKDGSRTIYFDAVKFVWKGIENTTVDLLGIYNESENKLGINDFDADPDKRDVTGYTGYYNDNVESGGGVYVKNKSHANMPLEAYYLYKDESDWTAFDSAIAGEVERPGREVHTVGTRLMPKLSDATDAGVEVAYQTGETDDNRDTEGWMADAIANWRLPCEKMKPVLSAGVYYLSGDDPDSTDEDEGWNPLWARYPQYSELYVYAFDAESAGRWSNVMMPHIDLAMAVTEKIKAKALVGSLQADEENGPGDGKDRGLLGTLRFDFDLGKKLLTEQDKLTGHLLAEVLDPGDYYNVDTMAHFLRWELCYAF